MLIHIRPRAHTNTRNHAKHHIEHLMNSWTPIADIYLIFHCRRRHRSLLAIYRWVVYVVCKAL